MATSRALAAFMGLGAFLVVTVYWLWQTLSGRPGLEPEEIAWRGFLAMVVTGAVGLLLGRLGMAVISEALQEAGARRRDRAALNEMEPAVRNEGDGDSRAGTGQERGSRSGT